jgi:hypothetical protein
MGLRILYQNDRKLKKKQLQVSARIYFSIFWIVFPAIGVTRYSGSSESVAIIPEYPAYLPETLG